MSFNSKAKRIDKKNLANDLQKEIDNKINKTEAESNFRSLYKAISLDDLSQDLKNKINSWGAPAGSSYDDTNLRDRIIILENDKANKNDSFNTTTDKVTKSLLDPVLNKLIDKLETDSMDHENKINTIESIVPNKADVRNKIDPINELDLSSSLLKKIDASFAYVQSTYPSGGQNTATDLTNIITDINNLKTNKADKSELANFRDLNTKISQTDLDVALQDFVTNGKQKISEIDSKVDYSLLAKYRKTDDLIAEKDITNDLLIKINTGYSNAANTASFVDTAVDSAFGRMKQDFILNELGDKYDRNILSLILQREIVAYYGITNDQYTFIHCIGWIANNYRKSSDYIELTDLNTDLQNKINKIAILENNITNIQTDLNTKQAVINQQQTIIDQQRADIDKQRSDIDAMQISINNILANLNGSQPVT